MTTEKINNIIISRFDKKTIKSSEIIDYILSLDSSVAPAVLSYKGI
jgi:hypothetical protein